MAEKTNNTLADKIPGQDILPEYLIQAIEKQISNDPIDAHGNLFLDQKTSDDLNAVLKNKSSISYFSKYLNRYILIVGYYDANFLKLKEESAKLAVDQKTVDKRKQLNHVYFSMPLPNSETLDVDALEATIENKQLNTPEQKAIKKLEKILETKPMNNQGYIFLTESERNEIGQEFLLNNKRIHLNDYLKHIEIGGVTFEVEEEMEKRFREYSFDQLNKYERLNTIIYPQFDDVKIKGRKYKAGWQDVDKKQLPLYLWTTLMGICFLAAICIIIWIFGFVVPTVNSSSTIYMNQNPPVDGAMVIQSLFPNAWTFLSHVAASITIFLFMFFFAWKPCKQMVENRTKYISNQIESAEMKNQEADIKLAYAAKVELESFLKTSEMLEEAVKTSTLKKEAIEKEAKENAEFIRNSAQQDALLIHQKMEQQIKQEIADNSIQIASELLRRNVSDKDNQQFVNDFISNLNNIKQ